MAANRISLHASDVPVKSVTIFQPSTAEVTRVLTVGLKSGTNVVEVSGISDRAEPSSPRIYGPPADAHKSESIRVLDVVCRRPAPDSDSKPNPPADAKAAALLAQSLALQSRWIVCQEEMGLLDSAARLATTPGSGVAADHAGLLAFVETFAQKKLAAHVVVRELDARIAEVEEELRVVRGARKGEARTVVAASVFAEKEGMVELRLTYLVSGVHCTPCYDLHVTMPDGQPSTDVSLRCCATVSQSTGEDWNDTTLTLSTATVQTTQNPLFVPSITPLRIRPRNPRTAPRRRPPPPPPPSSHPGNPREPPQPPPPPCGGYPSEPVVSRPPSMTTVPAPAPPPALTVLAQQASTPTAWEVSDWGDSESESGPILVEPPVPQPAPVEAAPTRNALSVAYSVPGALSLPSDGQEHRVTFATLNFTAELHHECVPRKSEAAFIVATVKNTSARSLLAGPVSVFVNESFVSQTTIQRIAVKESFRCVLGVDTLLEVAYRQYSTTERQPQLSSSPRKVMARTTTATIANQHTHAVAGLVVRDAIPLRNEAGEVAVTVRKPAGLAQAADGSEVSVKIGEEEGVAAKVHWMKGVDGKGSEKEGLYEWECAIPAGKTVTLEAQWDVGAESDEEWYEGP